MLKVWAITNDGCDIKSLHSTQYICLTRSSNRLTVRQSHIREISWAVLILWETCQANWRRLASSAESLLQPQCTWLYTTASIRAVFAEGFSETSYTSTTPTVSHLKTLSLPWDVQIFFLYSLQKNIFVPTSSLLAKKSWISLVITLICPYFIWQ